jgi:hypothetical protein
MWCQPTLADTCNCKAVRQSRLTARGKLRQVLSATDGFDLPSSVPVMLRFTRGIHYHGFSGQAGE